jgi:hypothetical protein
MWGNIPVIRLHIPPRPEAVVSCGQDENASHPTLSLDREGEDGVNKVIFHAIFSIN